VLKTSDYAIQVENFPETITNADDLKEHFTNLGFDVVYCHLARNYYNSLYQFKKLYAL